MGYFYCRVSHNSLVEKTNISKEDDVIHMEECIVLLSLQVDVGTYTHMGNPYVTNDNGLALYGIFHI